MDVMDRDSPHGHLPRLSDSHYRGLAVVHWVHAARDRKTGWLDAVWHARFRELMVHALTRYEILCPAYCLMPDHAHILWVGVSDESDQRKANAFLRRHVNAMLAEKQVCLQKQAYDHVLREKEREKNAFEKTAWYILENPVRAGLAKERSEWTYSGCVIPGHPGWSVFHDEYWRRFWEECEERATG